MDQSTALSESTKAQEADDDNISLQMPDDLAKQINECIAKYNGKNDASFGQVQGVIYKVAGKRIVLSHDMNQPVEIAGLRMTTLEAQRRLSFPDYVKAILGKSDEEKARLSLERAH